MLDRGNYTGGKTTSVRQEYCRCQSETLKYIGNIGEESPDWRRKRYITVDFNCPINDRADTLEFFCSKSRND